jgi:hypothetical protein
MGDIGAAKGTAARNENLRRTEGDAMHIQRRKATTFSNCATPNSIGFTAESCFETALGFEKDAYQAFCCNVLAAVATLVFE